MYKFHLIRKLTTQIFGTFNLAEFNKKYPRDTVEIDAVQIEKLKKLHDYIYHQEFIFRKMLQFAVGKHKVNGVTPEKSEVFHDYEDKSRDFLPKMITQMQEVMSSLRAAHDVAKQNNNYNPDWNIAFTKLLKLYALVEKDVEIIGRMIDYLKRLRQDLDSKEQTLIDLERELENME
jgi:hypothetical protein